MLDHLLPIQVKISRSFSHNQVATDLTRSHVGLRYFSQASLIPRTISSQWSPIQVKTFFRILSHNHMATAFTEIGRASCRERVWVSVVAGEVRKIVRREQ